MNFVEGTRFTAQKHRAQNSPYQRLLKPRSGGISYVLSMMGENMRHVIDVTIVYPDGVETAWEFFRSGRSRIVVSMQVLHIPPNLRGQDPDDPEYRNRFNEWLNTLWENKDRKIVGTMMRQQAH